MYTSHVGQCDRTPPIPCMSSVRQDPGDGAVTATCQDGHLLAVPHLCSCLLESLLGFHGKILGKSAANQMVLVLYIFLSKSGWANYPENVIGCHCPLIWLKIESSWNISKAPTRQCCKYCKSKTIEYAEPYPISPNIAMAGMKIYKITINPLDQRSSATFTIFQTRSIDHGGKQAESQWIREIDRISWVCPQRWVTLIQ